MEESSNNKKKTGSQGASSIGKKVKFTTKKDGIKYGTVGMYNQESDLFTIYFPDGNTLDLSSDKFVFLTPSEEEENKTSLKKKKSSNEKSEDESNKKRKRDSEKEMESSKEYESEEEEEENSPKQNSKEEEEENSPKQNSKEEESANNSEQHDTDKSTEGSEAEFQMEDELSNDNGGLRKSRRTRKPPERIYNPIVPSRLTEGKRKNKSDSEEFSNSESSESSSSEKEDKNSSASDIEIEKLEEAPARRRLKKKSKVPIQKKQKTKKELVASSQWSAEQEDFPEYPVPIKITSKDYKLDPDKILGAVENTKSTEGKQDNILVLVKFKEISYRKLKWITPHTFDKYYSTCKAKLTMFLKNLDKPLPNKTPTASFFNKDYVIIDKILDHDVIRGSNQYLVKWKSLPLEESTWEDDTTLKSPEDREKIKLYFEFTKRRINQGRTVPINPNIKSKTIEVPTLLDKNLKLRDYQVEGFQWLTFCWYQKRNSLLADEMGLGKTLQTISLLQYMRETHNIHGPFLIIVPLSTISQWIREINRCTDMPILALLGPQIERQLMKEHLWYVRDVNGTQLKNLLRFEVLVTTYDILLLESATLHKVEWECLILDEGHRVKNSDSKSLEKLKRINAKHKVILTGTPLQNNTKELWTLLNILDSKKFASSEEFLAKFGELKESEQVTELRKVLAPYLLRRMKEDVDKTIPSKEETIIEIELTSIQKAYYRAIIERNREFLSEGIRSKEMPRLLNLMMQVRHVCNHPFLIKGGEDKIMANAGGKSVEEMMVECSSKLVLVNKLLAKLKEGGHRVLLFSQSKMMLDILEDFLEYKKYSFERIDGSITGTDRQISIDRFCDPNSDVFVFLCTTKAGGLGINLTAADTVIIYDSDFNPQNDLQAQARAHRIGQTKDVKVYRLITRNTYEKHMFDIASKKLAMDQLVLNANGKSEENGDNEPELSKEQVDAMLKYGAYYLFKESVDEEKEREQDKQILAQDIDSILERAATIKYTFDEKAEKGALSGFSKAHFISSEKDMEIDINDQNFWQKIFPNQHSVKSLSGRYEDGSAFVNKSQYLEDLFGFVVRTKQGADNPDPLMANEAWEHQQNATQLLQLLIRLENNPKFSEEDKANISYHRALLETPRLRQRKTKSKRFSGQDAVPDDKDDSDFEEAEESSGDDEGEEGVDENANTDKNSKSRKKIDANRIQSYTLKKFEKDIFRRELLTWGYGRWKEIVAEVKGRTEEEIQSFAEMFIQNYFEAAANVYPFLNHMHLPASMNLYNAILLDTFMETRRKLDEVRAKTPENTSPVSNYFEMSITGLVSSSKISSPGERVKISIKKVIPVNEGAFILLDLKSESIRKLTPEATMFGTAVRVWAVPPMFDKGTIEISVPGFSGSYEVKCVILRSKMFQTCSNSIHLESKWSNIEEILPPVSPPNLVVWHNKLWLMRDVKLAVDKFGFNLEKLDSPNIQRSNFPVWWTPHCDKILVAFTYRFGSTHNYDNIKTAIEKLPLAQLGRLPGEEFPTKDRVKNRLHRVLERIANHVAATTTTTKSNDDQEKEKGDIQKQLHDLLKKANTPPVAKVSTSPATQPFTFASQIPSSNTPLANNQKNTVPISPAFTPISSTSPFNLMTSATSNITLNPPMKVAFPLSTPPSTLSLNTPTTTPLNTPVATPTRNTQVTTPMKAPLATSTPINTPTLNTPVATPNSNTPVTAPQVPKSVPLAPNELMLSITYDGKLTKFKVSDSVTFKQLLDKYKADTNLKDDIELYFGNTKLNYSQTPKTANLPNNSLLTVRFPSRRIIVDSYLGENLMSKSLPVTPSQPVKEVLSSALSGVASQEVDFLVLCNGKELDINKSVDENQVTNGSTIQVYKKQVFLNFLYENNSTHFKVERFATFKSILASVATKIKFPILSTTIEHNGKQLDLEKRPFDYSLHDKETITIKTISYQFGVKLPGGKIQQFKMKPHMKISSLGKHLPVGTKLALHGKPLTPTQTLLEVGVKDGDVLECL